MLRRALIIGITEYSENLLPHAMLDAWHVHEALSDRRFECIRAENCGEAEFHRSFGEVHRRLGSD